MTLAVQHRLTVDQVAGTFTVYPSLSGSIAEAARQLHPARLTRRSPDPHSSAARTTSVSGRVASRCAMRRIDGGHGSAGVAQLATVA